MKNTQGMTCRNATSTGTPRQTNQTRHLSGGALVWGHKAAFHDPGMTSLQIVAFPPLNPMQPAPRNTQWPFEEQEFNTIASLRPVIQTICCSVLHIYAYIDCAAICPTYISNP